MKGLSRRKAYYAYLRDFHAVDVPGNYSADQKKEVYEDIRAAIAASKGRLAATVRETCIRCVFGDGRDKLQIRDCSATACHLHPVRPFQKLLGRRRPQGVGGANQNVGEPNSWTDQAAAPRK